MNPRAFALLVLSGLVVLALVGWLVVWWVARQAGVRRAEYERMRQERKLYATAVAEIRDKADRYRDIDSVLATDIRSIIRKLDADRLEVDR